LAFPKGGAELVFKINNRGVSAEAGVVADRIQAVAHQIAGVRVLDQAMDYSDVMSLYASADVFVSLHRAEGLGLSLMECMALGKPVIATAWSGNMDFMTEENSCLVPFTLVPLDAGTQYHSISQGVPQSWAEPDIEAAATWMARLAASPELRQNIGNRARTDMEVLREEVGGGKIFTEIRTLAGKLSGLL
jgi:glycosyltransferase involved in cell wall biosynthesis